MLLVYLNYPRNRVSVHGIDGCSYIQRNNKKNQRVVRINFDNQIEEVDRFRNVYEFKSSQDLNDMWVEIHFPNSAGEEEVLERILESISTKYSHFGNLHRTQHCP